MSLPLSGEPLPLDLINTTFIEGGLRGTRVDALRDPQDLDCWLADRAARFAGDLAGRLAAGGSGPAELELFRHLRAVLRACVTDVTAGRTPADPVLAEINRIARQAVGWEELVPGEPVALLRRRPGTDCWQAAAGELAAEAIRLVTGPDRARLQACPAPGCILFFLRQHPRREWCTGTCGNRVRVARHSRRHRADAAISP